MRVLVRSDCSNIIGAGHVFRCLTLADELRSQGAEVVFACVPHAGHLIEVLCQREYEVIRMPEPLVRESTEVSTWLGATQSQDAARLLERIDSKYDWCIVDHYAIDRDWQSTVRKKIKRILVIDDLANRSHDADIILDQNYYSSSASRYARLCSEDTRLLLGPKYALLRPQFRKKKVRDHYDGIVRRIFVSFGGADSPNMTSRTLGALQLIGNDDIEIDVVVGPNYAHFDDLRTQCLSLKATLHRNVDNMAALMAAADLAVGASGSTTWERCAVGLPSLVCSLANNQVEIAVEAHRAGIVHYLGEEEDITPLELASQIKVLMFSPDRLVNLSETGRRYVDGEGVKRVVQEMDAI